MTTLLHVSSSPRGAASESLALASTFLATYREVHPEVSVETLDLWNPLSEVIGHAPTVELARTSPQDISRTAPEGGRSFRAKSRTGRRSLVTG